METTASDTTGIKIDLHRQLKLVWFQVPTNAACTPPQSVLSLPSNLQLPQQRHALVLKRVCRHKVSTCIPPQPLLHFYPPITTELTTQVVCSHYYLLCRTPAEMNVGRITTPLLLASVRRLCSNVQPFRNRTTCINSFSLIQLRICTMQSTLQVYSAGSRAI